MFYDDGILKHFSGMKGKVLLVSKTRWQDGNRTEGKYFLITNFLRICQNNAAGSSHEPADDKKGVLWVKISIRRLLVGNLMGKKVLTQERVIKLNKLI